MSSAINNHDKSESLHWMPCNIDYDGLAPVQMYFRPEEVRDSDGVNTDVGQEQEQHDTKESQSQSQAQCEPSESTSSVYAASFRGRGLLARQKRKLPEDVMGTVLLPPATGSSHQKKFRTGEVFHDVLEWEHEWNEQKLIAGGAGCAAGKVDVQSESSVEKALALIQLLRSVHDPIPVEE